MNAYPTSQTVQTAVVWSSRRAIERGATARARRVSGPHRPLPVIRGRGRRYLVVALVDANL
jgi:hypothetical protein